jgi:hypothetical protein
VSDTAIQLVEEGRHELTVQEVVAQANKIQELMKLALHDGQHYGVIPGTNKPTLLKPGAEKINLLFRIGTGDLQVIQTDLGNGHREITIKTPMVHIPTGRAIAYGVGSCSTMESKYRYRNDARKCPECGKATIIKGKEEYGGGWLCFKKKGGCGAKFLDNDEAITKQPVGQSENKDIADVYNTVLKMAAKRSYVDGTIKASAASDFFTQDVEDLAGDDAIKAEWSPEVEDQPRPATTAATPTGTPTGKPAHTLGDRLTTLIMCPYLTEEERAEIRDNFRKDKATGKEKTEKQRSEFLSGWEKDVAERGAAASKSTAGASDPSLQTNKDGEQEEIPFK